MLVDGNIISIRTDLQFSLPAARTPSRSGVTTPPAYAHGTRKNKHPERWRAEVGHRRRRAIALPLLFLKTICHRFQGAAISIGDNL